MFSSQLRAAASSEPITDPSVIPGPSIVEGQSEQALSQGQYKCLELSNKDHQENRTGEGLLGVKSNI